MAALLAGLAALWLHESDLAYAISQQRPIVLGRYTLEAATLLLAVTPLILTALVVIWKRSWSFSRQGVFKAVTVVLALLVTVIVADVALRLGERKLYVGNEASYHREPNKVYRGVFHDRQDSGGNPPVCHHLSAAASLQTPQTLFP